MIPHSHPQRAAETNVYRPMNPCRPVTNYGVTPTGGISPFAGVVSVAGRNMTIGGATQPELVPAIGQNELALPTALPSGEVVVPLATRPGHVYVVQVSDDLTLPITNRWRSVWTNSPSGGNLLYREIPTGVRTGRFYRVIER